MAHSGAPSIIDFRRYKLAKKNHNKELACSFNWIIIYSPAACSNPLQLLPWPKKKMRQPRIMTLVQCIQFIFCENLFWFLKIGFLAVEAEKAEEQLILLCPNATSRVLPRLHGNCDAVIKLCMAISVGFRGYLRSAGANWASETQRTKIPRTSPLRRHALVGGLTCKPLDNLCLSSICSLRHHLKVKERKTPKWVRCAIGDSPHAPSAALATPVGKIDLWRSVT